MSRPHNGHLCLREITASLPTTAAALGRVEHMTRHRMTNYQEVILRVNKECYQRKMDHLATPLLNGPTYNFRDQRKGVLHIVRDP